MLDKDYRETVVSDLLEQFRGQPNNMVLVESYAAQLQEVYEVLMSLLTMLDIDKCTGHQLDIIGEIVVMSRYDARVALNDEYEGKVLDDNLYRKLLKYKILLNTSDGTYRSLMKGIKMFWDRAMYYSEDPEMPATITLRTPVLTPDVDVSEIMDMPIPRPGGVGLRLIATVLHPMMQSEVFVGSCCGGEAGNVEVPELERSHAFEGAVYIGGAMPRRTSSIPIEEKEREHRFSEAVYAGGTADCIRHSIDELREQQ